MSPFIPALRHTLVCGSAGRETLVGANRACMRSSDSHTRPVASGRAKFSPSLSDLEAAAKEITPGTSIS